MVWTWIGVGAPRRDTACCRRRRQVTSSFFRSGCRSRPSVRHTIVQSSRPTIAARSTSRHCETAPAPGVAIRHRCARSFSGRQIPTPASRLGMTGRGGRVGAAGVGAAGVAYRPCVSSLRAASLRAGVAIRPRGTRSFSGGQVPTPASRLTRQWGSEVGPCRRVRGAGVRWGRQGWARGYSGGGRM